MSALAVPPVETSSTPWLASARANSISPVLSDTESRARVMRRRSVMVRQQWRNDRRQASRRDAVNKSRRPTTYSALSGSSGSSPRRRPARAGRCDMGEGPMHARNLAGAAVDHDLHGAARPVGAGQIDAFLDLDPILVGVEGPDVAVRQHQHGAMAVGQLVGLDGRMQMEPHRELVGHVRRACMSPSVGTNRSSPSRRLPVGASFSARWWITLKRSA